MSNNKRVKGKDKKVKTKLLIIRNTIIAYNLILFVITILQRINIIRPFKNIYLIWLITGIFLFILLISFGILEKYKISNKIYKIIVLLSIGLFMTTYYSWIVNGRANLINFSKNAVKVNAYIYDIKKDVKFHYDLCPGKKRKADYCCLINKDKSCADANDYYELNIIYYLQYNVNEKEYESKYTDRAYKRFNSEEQALDYKIKEKSGDNMIIYYDKNKPKNIRKYVAKDYGKIIYIIEIIVFLFNAYAIFKFSKYINDLNK